ncbi:MAG: hypothetical protein ACYC3S_10380 [Chloroflexota bacterium]
MNKRLFAILAALGMVALVLSLTLSAAFAGTPGEMMTASHNPQSRPDRTLALHDGMRKLWEDHITWTRLAIISLLAGTPDTDATVQRLLQNQTDIGNAIKPYYGDEAGNALTALLKDHIMIAADLVTAAKAGDSARFADANTRWYANADEIASFLSSANPDNWPLGEMKAMMHSHLDLTLAEAVARLQGDWEADVAAYDEIHAQILGMADMLSAGISLQFPQGSPR